MTSPNAQSTVLVPFEFPGTLRVSAIEAPGENPRVKRPQGFPHMELLG